MSRFEVGKKYSGWSKDRWTTPPSLVVVEIAEDRKTLLAVHPTRTDPCRAYEYSIVWDDRFGEKIVSRPPHSATVVWRADKVVGDADIPEGWYEDKKRKREDGARKAAETRATKTKLIKMAESIDMAKFLEIYSQLESWKSDMVCLGVALNTETLSQYLKVWKGEVWRDSKGWCITVGVSGAFPCDAYIDRWEKCEKTSYEPCWKFYLYIDKIRGEFSFPNYIKGDEFKAIFGDVK